MSSPPARSGAAFHLSVVVPVFDQAPMLAEQLDSVVPFLERAAYSAEVVVVSDGSTDDPRSALARHVEAERAVPVRLVEYAPNRGKGHAIRTGFRESRGAFVLMSDADFSTPIDEVDRLLARTDADLVVGSRRHEDSRIAVPQPWRRKISGNIFGLLVERLVGLGMLDTQCGFKLIRREAFEPVWDRLEEDRFAFDVELLALAREEQLAVATVGVEWNDAPSSTIRLVRDSLRTLHGVLALGRRLPSVARRQLAFFGILALVILYAARAAWMVELPLTDTTEGRYGTIMLEMAESGDWVTPRVRVEDELVPFWGKPPLTFWLGAASIRAFGPSEFATRLPSFLALIGVLLLIARVVREDHGVAGGRIAALVAGTCALPFAYSGATLLDMVAALTVTGMVVSFELATREPETKRHRTWGALFFVGVGLGLLAKGPVTVVLGLGPAIATAIVTRSASRLGRLPWKLGLLVSLAIAAPWYALAELRTPGFLEYFFVHEHFLRYVTSDLGDLYGKARTRPYGTIWLFAFAAWLPWTFAIIQNARSKSYRTATLYWWTVLLVPCLFFTPARSVLPTYVLPAVAGAAVLAVIPVLDRLLAPGPRRFAIGVAIGLTALAVVASLAAPFLELSWDALATVVAALAAALTIYATRARHFPLSTLAAALAVVSLGRSAMTTAAEHWVPFTSTRGILEAASTGPNLPPRPEGPIVILGSGEPSMDFYARTLGLKLEYVGSVHDSQFGWSPDRRDRFWLICPTKRLAEVEAGAPAHRLAIAGDQALVTVGDAPEIPAGGNPPKD